MNVRRVLQPTFACRQHSLRWHNKLYRPGEGLLSVTEAETKKNMKPEDENPMDYTIFGNKRASVFYYSDRKAGKGYCDFSTEVYHGRRYIWQPIRKLYKFNWYLLGALMAILLINPFKMYEFLEQEGFLPKAEMPPTADSESKKDERNDETDSESCTSDCEPPFDPECSLLPEEEVKKKRRKIGFRERRIIEYENRLRCYSSPDKIFRYFATLKVLSDDGSYDVFMTPEDFVRSLTPGVMQPRNLGLDKFKVFDPKKFKSGITDEAYIFHELGEYGLINFTDYLFLMTLLSTSPSEFRLAFGIFDVNGDGVLDKEEFQKVQKLLLSQTNVGQKHRDHVMGNSSFRWSNESAVANYFFGRDGEGKLSLETFLEFQHHLYRDILRIEFERRDPDSNPVGIISEVSFAELLLTHAGLNEKKQKRMIKRVRRKYKHRHDSPGISFDEVNDFFQFLYHIDDVDLALHFYKVAGKPLSKELILKVARKISKVLLTDNLVEVIITLFDENQDGELSHKEFVALMKKRMQRGLQRPKDTGMIRLLDAMWACSKKQAAILFLDEEHP